MRISVITVVYNGAATLEEAILSVHGQTLADGLGSVEHIVVDGASSDGTAEILERHRDKLARVVSEPDTGLYDAMNKGIALATGEVIGFLNADDVYAHERVLERIAETLADPALDACYADLVYVSRKDPGRIVRYWTSQPYAAGLFERGWLPAHPTFYVRRAVYERLGGFDLRYRYQADFELTMRFLAVGGISSRYVPEIWVRMRMGGTTNRSIGNVVRGNLESYRACREHGLPVTYGYFLTKALQRLPQFFRRPAP